MVQSGGRWQKQELAVRIQHGFRIGMSLKLSGAAHKQLLFWKQRGCSTNEKGLPRGQALAPKIRATQWLLAPRWAQAVVRFSTRLNSSYITMAMAPTTNRPANAKPICMDEPAEISR